MQPADIFSQEPVWKASFTFGHKDANGEHVSKEHIDWAKNVLKLTLSQICGGGRITSDEGFYLYTSGEVLDETSSTVWSFGKGEEIPLNQLLRIARDVARQLHQESVLFIVEKVPAFINFVTANDTFPEEDRHE